MARIKATCEDCGDVELSTADVVARRCIENDLTSYRFSCPQCGVTVLKEASPRTIELLLSAGVALERWSLPASLSEYHVGELIDHDDMIEFHDRISDEAEIERAMVGLLEDFSR